MNVTTAVITKVEENRQVTAERDVNMRASNATCSQPVCRWTHTHTHTQSHRPETTQKLPSVPPVVLLSIDPSIQWSVPSVVRPTSGLSLQSSAPAVDHPSNGPNLQWSFFPVVHHLQSSVPPVVCLASAPSLQLSVPPLVGPTSGPSLQWAVPPGAKDVRPSSLMFSRFRCLQVHLCFCLDVRLKTRASPSFRRCDPSPVSASSPSSGVWLLHVCVSTAASLHMLVSADTHTQFACALFV